MDATPGLRADPCEGSLVREPLFKEDTQRNFPISFGRLASTGGCATRCGFSQLAFTPKMRMRIGGGARRSSYVPMAVGWTYCAIFFVSVGLSGTKEEVSSTIGTGVPPSRLYVYSSNPR